MKRALIPCYVACVWAAAAPVWADAGDNQSVVTCLTATANVINSDNQSVRTHASCAESGQTGVSSSASATYGVLKADALAFYRGSSSTAIAFASFSDLMTIEAPGLDGTIGTTTIRFSPRWISTLLHEGGYGVMGVGASFNALASGVTSGRVIDAFDTRTDIDFDHHTETTTGGIDQTSATFEFMFGVPFSVSASLQATAQGNAYSSDGAFEGRMDAGHSVYWDGLGMVAAADGTVVNDYLLTSNSGTDYSHSFAPVPEPYGAVLLLAGMLGLALVIRRGASHVL